MSHFFLWAVDDNKSDNADRRPRSKPTAKKKTLFRLQQFIRAILRRCWSERDFSSVHHHTDRFALHCWDYICIIRKCQARYPPLYVSLRCAYSVDCCCRLRRSMGVVKTPLVLRRNSRMCISFGSIIVALERVRAPWLCSIATTWLCSGAAMHECA